MKNWLGVDMEKGKHTRREKGLIYFVEAEGLNRLKIGYTQGKFAARLAVIQTGSPVDIKPLLVWKDKTELDERDLHQMFKKYRLHGEWYVGHIKIYDHILMVANRSEEEGDAVVYLKNLSHAYDEAARICQNA